MAARSRPSGSWALKRMNIGSANSAEGNVHNDLVTIGSTFLEFDEFDRFLISDQRSVHMLNLVPVAKNFISTDNDTSPLNSPMG